MHIFGNIFNKIKFVTNILDKITKDKIFKNLLYTLCMYFILFLKIVSNFTHILEY